MYISTDDSGRYLKVCLAYRKSGDIVELYALNLMLVFLRAFFSCKNKISFNFFGGSMIKRILIFILVVALCCGFMITAFADDDTISATINIYQMINMLGMQ